jgi:RNA polymerase sigma factor (sigma-70 family)
VRCKRSGISARIRVVRATLATTAAPPQETARRGASATVEGLFRGYHQTAVRRCARRIGDVGLAEDAVQEGFIQVLQRLRRGDEELLQLSPEGVVQRNARWAASKLMARDRSVSAKARMLDDPSLARHDDPWKLLEMRWEVEAILRCLPESQREVLALRYVERLPDALSAEQLGLSVKAFRCRLDRALVAARQVARREAA